MSAPQSYYVPVDAGEAEFTEKRSRFLGHVRRVETEAEARAFLDEMRKKYYDARHNCWCYVLHEGGVVRYGDDGEPQGTAGQPMLNVFQREGVENVVCVVTRYFGGVLLGAGGLTRAYARGAKTAVEAGGIAVMRLCRVYTVRCSYPLYQRLLSMLEQEACAVGESVFTDQVSFSLSMREQDEARILEKLSEASAGTASAAFQCEKYVKYTVGAG